MTILITGGSGKTSRRLAALLASPAEFPSTTQGHPAHHVLLTSRKGTGPAPFPYVRLDWSDPSTYPLPFEHAGSPITAVYLVAPQSEAMLDQMAPFIALARRHGVNRFVLLSATVIHENIGYSGSVHKHLKQLGASEGVEWCVLRPTWFMENFSENHFLPTIRDDNRISTATGNGKVPFVSADDIAAVACRALVDEQSHDTDHMIVGPQLLSHDDVAAMLSKTLGRRIEHAHLSVEELAGRYEKAGMPRAYADMLADMDVGIIAQGKEEIRNDVVETVTGRPPKSFDAFVQENKKVWTA